MIVRTYDTAAQRGGILRHLLGLFGYSGLIWRNRYMVHNFFRRELMGRFHGSFLGAWWMLVQPIVLFAIYYLVFGMLYGRGGDDPNFAVYLFSGVIVFHSVSEATMQSCNSVTGNSSLVKKVAFPSEVLPIPIAMIAVVLYLIGAVVCLVSGLIIGSITPGWHWLLIPVICAVQFVMCVGMGLFLANANVFIRDVGQLWRIVTMAWMFLSPVFWKPDMAIGALGRTWADVMFHVNPMFSLVMLHRYALGGELLGSPPGAPEFWSMFWTVVAWSFGFLALGYSMFAASKHKFADVV